MSRSLAYTGFFLQLDSEDEREDAALKNAQEKRMLSQITQKQMKNQSRLPRTAGMRTLTELTGSLTKAGLDPSRIQERAEILAKIQGEARRKRKREEREEAGGMEVDGDGANADEGGEASGWTSTMRKDHLARGEVELGCRRCEECETAAEN